MLFIHNTKILCLFGDVSDGALDLPYFIGQLVCLVRPRALCFGGAKHLVLHSGGTTNQSEWLGRCRIKTIKRVKDLE
jgi:hypothetical protein